MSYDFPDDLLHAQRDLDQATADLHALYATLPISAEPTEAYRDDRETGYWHARERPASPGWTEEQKRQVADARARRLELTSAVVTHVFWATLGGPDAVKARSALKHATEAAAEGPEST
ncbi:hypothetical protein [Streptomyces sp. Ac-502]|uniref:hypothetical protein n=1 Tax=Streptomyces sp. Ac-502 TaxID=3342801 RepID=UPI003862C77C